MNLKKTLLFLILIGLFFSCKMQLDNQSRSEGIKKEDVYIADEHFNKAYEEARTLIVCDVSRFIGYENNSENIFDELEGLAWTTVYTEDYKEFITRVKYYGLYDDLKQIVYKHNLKENEELRIAYSLQSNRSVTEDNLKNNSKLRNGDILLCSKWPSSGGTSINNLIASIFINGKWKHAGLYCDTYKELGYICFSASDKADINISTDYAEVEDHSTNIGRVGYEKTKDWASRKEVSIQRVVNSTKVQGQNALNSVLGYEGCGFKFFTTREEDDYWYCSKLVYRAWKSQDFNIEADAGSKQGKYVTPTDIYNDADTEWLYGDE